MGNLSGTIDKRGKILVGVGALLLAALFIFPIWSYRFQAPQYPEGLGMNIWVNNLTGAERHDIANINILNHYVGMKELHVEMFPEFVIMPYIVAGMIVFGLITAGTGFRPLLYLWLLAFVALAILGFVVFYSWAYDYGHNLNPEAPIRAPGMTFMPPVIGTKTLAQFYILAFPNLGTVFAVVGFGLAFLAAFLDRRKMKSALQE